MNEDLCVCGHPRGIHDHNPFTGEADLQCVWDNRQGIFCDCQKFVAA